jgi:hypothetical protein
MAEESKTKSVENLIKDKLLKSDYYKNQLTLLLRNSYGVPEQIDLYTKILNMLNQKALGLFNLLGIGVEDEKIEDYYHWHMNLKAINDLSETESDLLDKIAEIVGCSRYYSFLTTPLNNTELYILIYFKIKQNNFLGTNKEMEDIYKEIFNRVNYTDITISYITSKDEASTCFIILNHKEDTHINLVKLFEHDMLALKSVGIKYQKLVLETGKLSYFDKIAMSVSDDGTITYDETSDYCKFGTAYFC